MNIHRARGRNLHPVNYGKELFLRYNLGPLHILMDKFIPEIVKTKLDDENKHFYRKVENTRPDKIKFDSVSATVGNFRTNEVQKSHLPLEFFK